MLIFVLPMHTDLLLKRVLRPTQEAPVRSDDDASLILVPLGIKLTLELELLWPVLREQLLWRRS